MGEKIVQKAIELVLSSSYEPRFLDYSHGFRKNRGIQTALRELDLKFRSARYILEADIKKAFPSISHKKLLEILSRDCKCDKTISFIKSAFGSSVLRFFGSSVLRFFGSSVLRFLERSLSLNLSKNKGLSNEVNEAN